MNFSPNHIFHSLGTKYLGYCYIIAFVATISLLIISHILFVKQIDRQETIVSIGILTPKQQIIFQQTQSLITEILDQSVRPYPSQRQIKTLKDSLIKKTQDLVDISEKIHSLNLTILPDGLLSGQAKKAETKLLSEFQKHVAFMLASDQITLIVNYRELFIKNMELGRLGVAYDQDFTMSQKATEASIASMRKTHMTLTIGLILSIILGTLFVFWPLIRRLQEEYKLTLASQEVLKHQAFHDDLTGIGNRKFFTERLENKIRNINNAFTISILDLNNFKEINDTYGHQEGDWCLKTVAKSLRRNLREEDQVARLGGDEFVIIFNHTNLDDLNRTIERIKEDILKISKDKYPGIQLSFSYGLARYPADAQDFDSLFSIADTKMYQQKSITVGLAKRNLNTSGKLEKNAF